MRGGCLLQSKHDCAAHADTVHSGGSFDCGFICDTGYLCPPAGSAAGRLCAQCGRGGDLPLLQCLLRTLLLIGGAGRVLRRLRFCGKASTVWRGRRDPLPDAFPEFVSAGIAAGGGAFPVGPAATNFASAP